MEDGFQIISVKASYYMYVLVGWARVTGMKVRLYNCRVIRRYGRNRAIAELAVSGPYLQQEAPTQLLALSKVEGFHLLNISRSTPADPAKWAKECPMPDDWRE